MPASFGLYKNFKTSEFRDPGVIFGDFFVFKYQITDGSDLDIRFGILSPSGIIGYVGWGAQDRLTTTDGYTVAYWAGDNTGTGTEMVYIDKSAMLSAFPGTTAFEFDLRGFWYYTVGVNPIIISMDAYQGGTMINSGVSWANPTATNSFPAARSFTNNITLQTQNAQTQGQRISRAIIDFDTDIVSYFAT
jgi:hypothetical protein